ncbi:MAG: TrkA C-terminal domain-containing protein, partial [Schleiferiaceae bacterium]
TMTRPKRIGISAGMIDKKELQAIGVKQIIARAQGPVQREILTKMGIEHVLSPELEVANNVAEQLTTPGVLMCVNLPDEHEIIEVAAPKKLHGRTLEDIGLRKKYTVNLITVLKKSDDGHHIKGVPGPDTVIDEGDIIMIFGLTKDVNRFIEINA